MYQTDFLKAVLAKMPFITEAEDENAFFRRVAHFLSPMDGRYRLIEKAYRTVKESFQKDKRESGEETLVHLRSTSLIELVYMRIEDHVRICAGLLHDIKEDKPLYWTLERISIEFGDEVALLLSYLSKPSVEEFPNSTEKERIAIYHRRFEYAPRAFFDVKMADRFHNLVTLWACTLEKRRYKIQETKTFYLPYARKHFILLHELEAAVESLETESKTEHKAST